MTWRKILPNSITLAALMAAFFSIVASAEREFVLAAQLIMLTLILDGLDGIMARLLRGTSKLGAELDTFVDMTGYSVAPAAVIYFMTYKVIGVWALVLVMLTLFSGAIRLSRFRLVDPYRGQHGYMGLPITVNAGWVAMIVILCSSSGTFDLLTLTTGLSALIVWGVSAVMLFLQVSRVRYGKPVKKPVMFILGAVVTLLLFFNEFMVAAAYGFSIYAIYFAFISPFLGREDLPSGMAGDEEDAVSANR